jgi:HD-like signal output (HDOD) protein
VGQAGTTTDARERALTSLNRLPAFSPVLNKLIATTADENVSFSAIGDLIEKDAVLAGQLLRLVNSAVYTRHSQVNSVRHAVAMIGTRKLRNFALGISVSNLWHRVQAAPGWSHAGFNLHSVTTAMMTDLLAQYIPVEYAEGAFTSGLLHDMGKLLVAISLPDQFDILSRCGGWEPSTEAQVLGFTHAELSADVLERWRLPAPIRDAVRAHHTSPMNPERPVLADLVALADSAVRLRKDPIEPQQESACCALAGWGIDGQIPRIEAEITVEMEAMRALF